MKRLLSVLLALLLLLPVCGLAESDGPDFSIEGTNVFSAFDGFTMWDDLGGDPEKLAFFAALTLKDAEAGLKHEGFRLSALTDIYVVSISGMIMVDAYDASCNWWLCPLYDEISVYVNDVGFNITPQQTINYMKEQGHFGHSLQLSWEQLEPGLAYVVPTVEGMLAEGGQENLFRNAESLSVFRQGLARFSVDDAAGYIRTDGTLLMDDWNYANIFDTNHPYATVFRGTLTKYGSPDEGVYGLIDTEGNYVLPMEYDYIEMGSEEDYAYVRRMDGVAGYYHISTGSFLWLEGYDYVAPRFYNGLIGVFNGTLSDYGSAKDGKWGFVDTTGKLVIPQEWDSVSYNWDDGLCVVRRNEKYGAIDQQGQLVIPCRWEDLDTFMDGYTIASEGSTHHLMDTAGNIKMSTTGKYVYVKSDQWIAAYNSFDNEGGLLDYDGNVLIPRKWSDLQAYGENLMRLGRKNGDGDTFYGLMDMETGRLVANVEWEGLQKCNNDGYYRVERDGLYGYMNAEYQVFVEPQYEEAMLFTEGFACVKEAGRWQIIDLTGEVVY